MRSPAIFFSAAILCAVLGAAPTPSSTPAGALALQAQDAGDPLANLDLAKERGVLKKLAETLAKSGRTRAVSIVQEEFVRFGASEKELGQLRSKTTKALLKAKPARNAKAAAKQVEKDLGAVEKAAAAIAERAAAESGAAAEALCRTAVRLDSACEGARKGLGHTLDPDGAWRSEAERRMWTYNREFAEVLAEVRGRRFDVEELEPKDTLLTETATGPVAAVGYGPVRLEGEMTLPGLEHRLQQVLRAAAFANWIVSGEAEPQVGEFSIAVLPTCGPWNRYLDGAVAHGWINSEERTASVAVTGSWQIPNRRKGGFQTWYVANTNESLVEILNKVDRCLLGGKTSRDDWDKLWKGSSSQAPYWVSAGLTNLVGLSVIDDIWNNIAFEKGSPTDGSAVSADGEEIDDKRHLMTLPVARTWMAREVAAGRAMDFTDVLRTRKDDMTSRRLLQLTFMVEFLAARDGLGVALERYRTAVGPEGIRGPAALMAAMEPLLGQPVDEFRADWEAWLLAGGQEQSVRGLLVSSPSAAVDLGDAREWLELINNVRLAGGAPEAKLEVALSVGCVEYAESLKDGELSSAAGRWAADHAVVATDFRNPIEAIEQWLGNLHDRSAILRPSTEWIGIGIAGKAVAVDAVSASFRSGLWHAHWPPHETRGLPTEYSEGGPQAVAGVDNASLGYPVTLMVGSAHGEPEVEMTMTGPDGEVDCYFTSPNAPLNPEHVPAGVYALIPKEPLTGGREYSVTATWGESELEWSFITD